MHEPARTLIVSHNDNRDMLATLLATRSHATLTARDLHKQFPRTIDATAGMHCCAWECDAAHPQARGPLETPHHVADRAVVGMVATADRVVCRYAVDHG